MTTSPVMTITDELLAELEQKAKAATPGLWIDTESDECPEHERWVEAGGWSVCSTHSGIFGAESQYPNAEYIAAANPATILALVEHIRSLTERLEYIQRNYVGSSFNWDDDGMCVLAIKIGDRVPVTRDFTAVIDAAIAQEGSHE